MSNVDPADPVFRVNHLVKQFNGLRAVNDVSTEIHQGEAVFVLRPSGSGKSAFLR